MADQPGDAASMAKRAARYARWRRAQVSRSLNARAFLDPVHRSDRSLYLSSWPRSGSTWLAELIASAPHTRLVFEPSLLNAEWSPGLPRVATLPRANPGEDLARPAALLDDALTGRLRSEWSDRIRTTRVATQRVVKDVNTIEALPWIADRFQDVPVVILLRHPMAVCHSIVELGTTELGWSVNGVVPDVPLGGESARTPTWRKHALEAEATEWARHHAWALSHPALRSAHVIFYEDLVSNPHEELERLATHLLSVHPRWRRWKPDLTRSAAASATSFRRSSGTAAQWVDSWSATYAASEIDAVLAVLDRVGLGDLYGSGPRPLIDASHVLATVSETTRRRGLSQ